LDSFIRKIQQDISVSCMTGIQLNKPEIIRIINLSKDWFYKKYEDSIEEKFLVLDSALWSTPEFKKDLSVKLPDEIFAVNNVVEMNKGGGNSLFSNIDPDFSINKFLYKDVYQPSFLSDNLMNYVINDSLIDMAKHLLVSGITTSYNRLTHKLRFTGHTPKNHLVLLVGVKIDDCSLFADEIFFRYVSASAKRQLRRVLGTFDFNYPGGVKINFDILAEEGKETMKDIEDEISGDEGVDYFFTSNNSF